MARASPLDFGDAQLIKVSDQRELNFLLTPFLSRQVPLSMKVDAADCCARRCNDTFTSVYKVPLQQLKVHSMAIEGDSSALRSNSLYHESRTAK